MPDNLNGAGWLILSDEERILERMKTRHKDEQQHNNAYANSGEMDTMLRAIELQKARVERARRQALPAELTETE